MRISDLVPWRGSRAPARREEEDGESLHDVRREMNRLFDDFFRGGDLMAPLERGRTFTPSVNVTESDEAIEVTAELPGMNEDDIDLTLSRKGLTIRGEKREEKEDEGRNYYTRERSYGYFQRSIPVSVDAIDQEKVEATFDKGVLTITLPKHEKAQSATKRIEVKSG
ncbi:MAG: Hsp20/alpha crystallin family protein [Candidatus Promineifilaceae bacterium]|nr:Hsp20/alpha crystallin family protein [Candidatus Promineifilaceae bacterium]